MPWVIKHKRSPGSRITAEYECPVHGRQAVDVTRDDRGDPPALARCPVYERIAPDQLSRCPRDAPFVISAPARCRVQRVTAARRGKDPEPPPGAMDWKALAYDEMSEDDWEKKERKRDFEDVHRIVKKALA